MPVPRMTDPRDLARSWAARTRARARLRLKLPAPLQCPAAWRGGIIVGSGLAALALALILLPASPFTLLYAYVIFVTWFGGTGSGLAALATAAAAGVVLMLGRHALLVDEVIFVAASLFLLAVMHDLRRARRRAQEARAQALADRQEAQAAQQRTEEAIRLRDEFLTAAAHDLRTPLTNVIGRTELMRMHLDAGGAIDMAWLRTQMTSLRYAAKRMQSMIAEITDAAQLQEGKSLSLQTAEVDMSLLARTAAETVRSGTRRASDIVIEAAPDTVVLGDQARLERVLENVLTNAVKYSPAGTPVRVDVTRTAHWVVAGVRDTGVGIPKDELPHVFTRFYRASTAWSMPGAGLGLAGCKRIVEQHGGYITIDSAVGKGTTVAIYLPCAPARNDGYGAADTQRAAS